MQNCSIDGYDFHQGHEQNERRVYIVLLHTIVTMVVEILAGFIPDPRLLYEPADGFHVPLEMAGRATNRAARPNYVTVVINSSSRRDIPT